ncbi:hypothetical protein NQ315_011020 [Exocentrus adspersus]|uniref:DUF4817 domain-containing protein n=1 Tax=Exocentrus adspersus TaxID=1586481 RepID=A0AAV8VK61_9CUCU|nr:hypothetical protein NQ315_011020 [Exocentrus adspersus]
MHKYTNEEKLDILEYYLKCNRNAESAQEMYLNNFPERFQPEKKMFRRLVINLLNDASFDKKREKSYNLNHAERSQQVLNALADNPSGSVRQFSHETGIPKTIVHRVIVANKFHPYKPKTVHTLNENDYPRRRAFCNWYINKCNEDNNFHYKVVWTDETRVTNCGIFNKHNRHYWAVENPHLKDQRRSQNRFGTNVWCGIVDNRIIGPFFYNENLNGVSYLNLLQNDVLPAIRRIVPQAEQENLWFQQDGMSCS